MVKEFMGDDFLLENEPSKVMFEAAEKMPIFDWHCHLSPKEVYENKNPQNITQLWLYADHYKWRCMRSCGVDEYYITGEASDFEKFEKFASVMPLLIGNPMYHWCHLELRRYFGIYDILNSKNAEKIYDDANAKIAEGGFSPRELMEKSNVSFVFTTDDPADSLEYHQLLAKEENFKTKVYPAFRPDKALGIELNGFLPWLSQMEQTANCNIDSFDKLCSVLSERIDFFASLGCKASDHAFSYVPYSPADAQEINEIFLSAKSGKKIDNESADKYKTALMKFLAKQYVAKNFVMEIHIGPMRNNNTKMFDKKGPDMGFDSIDDCQIAYKLSRFLDSLDKEDILPKTVLFCLNPKDNYVLGTMLGNFQGTQAKSKIQFGSGWWFNDNIDGMREQMKALGNLGALGCFVGMVTDSRSFLSYPRHEYFRRIMCNLLGDMVEKGYYPFDKESLITIAEGISYNNSYEYFFG